MKVSPDLAGCWTWTATTHRGYGRYWWRGTMAIAHRVAYTALVGEIPDGIDAHHTCGNKSCVNPAHIELVAHGEHSREHGHERQSTAKWQRAKTHCPSGHAYAGENLYLDKQGHRKCRACHRARQHRRYHERRAST
jgi:hypothetical protein